MGADYCKGPGRSTDALSLLVRFQFAYRRVGASISRAQIILVAPYYSLVGEGGSEFD